jgi:hypothetical protein
MRLIPSKALVGEALHLASTLYCFLNVGCTCTTSTKATVYGCAMHMCCNHRLGAYVEARRVRTGIFSKKKNSVVGELP